MSSFHKPKLFRSVDGCCICKAKSSSSRFTDSSRYEEDFQESFRLQEERVGEICNACVLLVKRWRKLPKNNKRDWAHVVDARAGPGVKSFVKKKAEKAEEFHKIRRKKRNRKLSSKRKAVARSPTPLSDESFCSDVGALAANSKKRIEASEITDYFCPIYWTRKLICCGVIFQGMQGEVMVDPRQYQQCSRAVHGRIISKPSQLSVENLIESELKKLAEHVNVDGNMTNNGKMEKENSEGENDEGFCDKASTFTDPSSPDSCKLRMEEF